MRIRLLTISHKVPKWVEAGFKDYIKRLHSPYTLELIEIPAEKRNANKPLHIITDIEDKKILSSVKRDHFVIALDSKGKMWTTNEVANHFISWQQMGKTIDFIIGGPDGLSTKCFERANVRWSLSLLTFPHTLVRVIFAEQLYRVISILNHHPYHR